MKAKKISKMLICLFICFAFEMTVASAFTITHSGTGETTGSSGSSTVISGGMIGDIYGVRVTLVQKSGTDGTDVKRLKVKVSGQVKESSSIDFYGSTTGGTCDSYGCPHVSANTKHSVCKKSNGETTLCYKRNTAGSSMEFESGGYSWHNISEIGLSLGNYLPVEKGGFKIADEFVKLTEKSKKNDVKNLFKILMGVSLDDALKKGGSSCQENKKGIEEAYIIYEPLTQVGGDDASKTGTIGTASEVARYYYKYNTSVCPCYNWLPSIGGGLKIPTSSGNLGLKYFKAVDGRPRSCSCSGNNYEDFKADSISSVGYYMGLLHLTDSFSDEKLQCSANYSLDAVCTGCSDSTNKSGSTYQVKDTSDWDSILNSAEATNNDSKTQKNIRKYFEHTVSSTCTVYCREEYNVTFPNINFNNGKFNVTNGRYFTVNRDNPLVTNGIPNFGPIKVNKIRECQSRTDTSDPEHPKESCPNISEAKKLGVGEEGSVRLSYKELNKGNYELNTTKLDEKTKEETPKISGKTIKFESTTKYELPSKVFKYVENGTGKATSTEKKDTDSFYLTRNLGIPTLPVSFENYITNDSENPIASISLNYSLPGKDEGTHISQAVNNPNYFGSTTENENLYKKYINGALTSEEEEQLKKGSCASLYTYSKNKNSKFYECASKKTTDAVGKDCRSQLTGGAYTCFVSGCKQDERVCPDDSCVPTGEPCPETPKCKVENGKYYDNSGTEVTEEEYKNKCTCTEADIGQYYDKNGNLTSNYIEYKKQCPGECAVKDGKYYGEYGIEVSPQEYREQCPDGNPPGGGDNCSPEEQTKCPDNASMGLDPCYRCPYTGLCPMPGNVCPYPSKDVIYRPIDLTNPFPSQAGTNSNNRDTGSNWCSHSLTNNTIDCRGGNSGTEGNEVVQKQIKENRKKTGYDLYKINDDDVLYTVELDATAIKHIQNYNKANDYDDWKIVCTKSGTCHSTFLNKEVTVTGICSKDSNLATCAER